MTEAEAKTKWCPFARTVTWQPDGHSYPRNRVIEVEDGKKELLHLAGTHCIGSACMAWRWSFPGFGETVAANPGSYTAEDLARASDGHCGLAGKP